MDERSQLPLSHPRGSGTGGWSASRQKIGTGWGIFSTVLSPGDFTSDRMTDVLAVNASGDLVLYRGNGKGGWAATGQKVALGF